LARLETRQERLSKQELQTAERRVAQAQTRDSIRVFAKRAREVNGELRIVAEPPLIRIDSFADSYSRSPGARRRCAKRAAHQLQLPHSG
jgi:hypothetical protein